MSKRSSKDYRRPYMVVEQFTPNEFVAGCVQGNGPRLSGLYCVDSNKNGSFDYGEEKNTGPGYLGSHLEMVLAGNFEIVDQGPYVEEGAPCYMYVGEVTFDRNPGHLYSGNDFAPLLYANIVIHYQWYDYKDMIYFADDGSGVISTAS